MQEVADKTGLSEAQVYKWGWDQKRKKGEDDDDTSMEMPPMRGHEPGIK